MKSWLRWTILALVVMVVLAVILFKAEPERSDSQTDLVRKPQADETICDTVEVTSGAEEVRVTSRFDEKERILPRMLELGSVGCRPCDMMAPIIEDLREEYIGRLSVEFYDVRKDPTPARQYRIRVIPTQIFLDAEGNEFFRHEGYLPKEEVLTVLDQMGVSR
ncbi:MAG TPA: hypothetical protein ENF16_05980 [Bacteroidetes bacterium]|nr:hypothetical protein [Bacteroidota bacterium]